MLTLSDHIDGFSLEQSAPNSVFSDFPKVHNAIHPAVDHSLLHFTSVDFLKELDLHIMCLKYDNLSLIYLAIHGILRNTYLKYNFFKWIYFSIVVVTFYLRLPDKKINDAKVTR